METDQIESMRSENFSMRGKLSAIATLLNDFGVPNIGPLNKRLKLLMLTYERDKAEMAILKAMLEAKET